MIERGRVKLAPVLVLVLAALIPAGVAKTVHVIERHARRAQLSDQLCRVVASGDLSSVQRLLAEGASPNAYRVLRHKSVGLTGSPLHDWYWYELRRKRYYEESALVTAIRARRFDIARLLIKGGAAVDDDHRRFRQMPLSIAVHYCRDPAFFRLLLDRGANVNRFVSGGTALTMKVNSIPENAPLSPDNREIVLLLLERGADPAPALKLWSREAQRGCMNCRVRTGPPGLQEILQAEGEKQSGQEKGRRPWWRWGRR